MKLRCDKCGKDIVEDEGIYTLATDEEAGTGRHWDCHKKMKDDFTNSLNRATKAMDAAKELLDKLKREL